ncbi:MAG: MBL fold metallo-hydrolase [Fibromonadaceae bacterium]|jgi:glyoxylase-like metal-dependent hydrolase (beta-lactamase superfamily II)|nr:MBL fold metallo-hydrolase [Fibromonadaceae bacterium]
MNKLLLSLALISVAMFACSKNVQSTQSNKITLGCGIEVTAIDDRPGEMDISLFSGVLTEEQKQAYMPGGKAPSSVNVFLVKTAGNTYMIDAGFGNAVKDKRIKPETIDGIFITHKHGDHIMGLLNEDGTAVFSAPIYVSGLESEYWLSEETLNSELQKNLAKAYEDRYKTFNFGDILAPGIVAINGAPHTPGHTAFLVGNGQEKILIAGDFLHAAALQFPEPTESANFDMDKEGSVKTRIALMEQAEKNDWLIAGVHIPNPGWGKVKSNGKGGFTFAP